MAFLFQAWRKAFHASDQVAHRYGHGSSAIGGRVWLRLAIGWPTPLMQPAHGMPAHTATGSRAVSRCATERRAMRWKAS